MKAGKLGLLLVSAIVCVAVGFFVGQIVQASSSLPGTDDDPVVTRSYVEEAMSAKIATLRTQIEELQAEVDALKGGAPVTPNKPDNKEENKKPEVKPDTKPAVKGDKVKITTNVLNVRASASTTADKIGSLSKDTEVELLKDSGAWYQIKMADGKTGWISSEYAVKVK